MPVLKKPGSTIDTLTPKPATSIRRTSDSASSANFEAWYQPFSGMIAARPNIDETITIRPAPRSRIAGSAHDDTTAGAMTLTSSCLRAASAETSSTAPSSEYPALLTTA